MEVWGPTVGRSGGSLGMYFKEDILTNRYVMDTAPIHDKGLSLPPALSPASALTFQGNITHTHPRGLEFASL